MSARKVSYVCQNCNQRLPSNRIGERLCVSKGFNYCEPVDGLHKAAPELYVACAGALSALVLGPYVDKQQAIDYLQEVLAKVEGRDTSEPGTPKTLEESIRKGINVETGAGAEERCALAGRVMPHVRDYLAQKFSGELMDDPRVMALWKSIVEETS